MPAPVITHAYVNPKADGGDATITRPSNWNAAHVITGAWNNPLEVTTYRTAPWDDFDDVNGTALTGRVMPSGHTWGVTGTGAAACIITNQAWVTTANSYIFVTDSQPITECECVFSFLASATQVGVQSTTGTISFTTDSSNPISGTSKLLHFQFSSEGMSLLKSLTGPGGLGQMASAPVELNGVPFNVATTGTWYGVNLKIDGTRYKIRMVVNLAANTLTIYMPDGTVAQWTDADISTIMTSAATAFWQSGGNGTTGFADIRFHGCAIGPSKAGSVIEACTDKDTAIMRGVFAVIGGSSGNGGYSQRLQNPQIIVQTPSSTTIGWYTIATESPDTGNPKMGGSVTIWGRDSTGRPLLAKVFVGAEIGSNPPYFIFSVQGFLGQFSSGIVDQFRLSQDNTGKHIQLDVHISQTAAMTIYANYEGYFTPTLVPVVGATVLGTWSQIYVNPVLQNHQPSHGSINGVVLDLPPVANVPIGTRGFVTNSNATLAAGLGNTVAGAGTNKVPVYNDGTTWKIG